MSFLLSLLLSSSLSFGAPVNYPISLAGNFGEPRPNHFHGGIDIRTNQVEGKPIFSVADGYVSRITVGLNGFGSALYVRHPNGITSVYCHLKKFIPQLSAFVRKWQYENKNYFADVEFRPTDYPVAKGQLIAVSGNTGASKAPHLHLEFHDSKTDAFLDPLRYLKDYVTDTTAPIAHSFMVYPVKGEGVFCGSQSKQSYGFSSNNLTRQFTAWGKVGFGIWANDYMEGSYGILGIRRMSFYVDGKLVFRSDVDSIPAGCNRMVNSWGDYEHYCRTHIWYMRSFAEPGNTLPILHFSSDRGIIFFDQERDYHLTYTIADVFDNVSSYSFTVRGVKQKLPEKSMCDISRLMRYDRFNSFQRPGISLYIPPRLLPDDVELHPDVSFQSGAYSDVWSFFNYSYPLFDWATLTLRLNKKVKDPTKLYIVGHYGTDRYMGGEYDNGWVSGRIRELGARYEIAYDDKPPVISGFSFGAGRIRVAVSDSQSGIKSLQGYVDGLFVLFEHVEKTNLWVCNIDDTPIKKLHNLHVLEVVAVDNRDNKNVFTTGFEY